MEGDVFERVFTVTDYYDGPREGIANLRGRPHYYKTRYNDLGPEADLFDLWPLDHETFTLALESWSIWKRWETAFHQGETSIETHPALPSDRSRFEQIERIVAEQLAAHLKPCATKEAEFRAIDGEQPPQGLRHLEVRWIDPREAQR
ncbi:MAG TPA: hypothetical protein VF787_06360 [Thermoanaerobaculia bacterium]